MTPLQLLDMPVDILFQILRYVPFKDKIYTLLRMPEFRPLLQTRACYPAVSAPFSPLYLDLLSGLRPGGYFHREDWFHRLYLRIDETSWTCFNFKLEFEPANPYMQYKSCGFFKKSIENTMKTMDIFFQKFCHNEDEALLTYYLESYGFIVVSSTRSKMRFCDKKEYSIEKNRLLFFWIDSFHVEVLWNHEDKLVVTFHVPPGTRIHGEKKQKLSPIFFQHPEDYKRLTRHEGTSVLRAWWDEYTLKNEQKIEGVRYFQ